MTYGKVALALGILGVAFASAGCSGGNKAEPTAIVKGTLKHKGQPLADAQIMFVPEKGRPAVGRSDASGNYALRVDDKDGATVGTNKVVVTKMGPPEGMTEEQYQQAKSNAGPGSTVPKERSVVPDKYTMSETTPLSVKVEAGKENTIPLDIPE